MGKIKWIRPLTDYAKIQTLIGNLIRGKKIFIRRKALHKTYLDIGCGANNNEKFINLDYTWSTKIDVCWDLTKKNLPFNSNTITGVFSEHCFEHIPLNSFIKSMKEIYRILKPGGTLRLIMPDGELYLDIYNRKKTGENLTMPYEEGYITPIHRINGIFRNHGHQFIYDFETVEKILKEVGFNTVNKESCRNGRDENLLIDNEERAIESLYVEAIK